MPDSHPHPASTVPVITLDGGAATGKSSTARGVAGRLNLLHVDTGSHYRAITHLLLKRKVEPVEGERLRQALAELDLSAHIEGTGAGFVADGQAIPPDDLRSESVNQSVSTFAALPSVRKRLLSYQRWFRDLAGDKGFGGLIMEGRDIGSVVFPDACLRFFLEADAETRVRRRSDEGQTDSVVERDKADAARKTAPLLCPDGALRIDTGSLTLEEVIDEICRIVSPVLEGASA